MCTNDLFDEGLITLAEAAKLPNIPKRAPSVWHQWATRGVEGVKLEVLRVGGVRCTSVPAVRRFFQRLTTPATPAQARKAGYNAACAMLDAAGIA